MNSRCTTLLFKVVLLFLNLSNKLTTYFEFVHGKLYYDGCIYYIMSKIIDFFNIIKIVFNNNNFTNFDYNVLFHLKKVYFVVLDIL